jgi:DNA-binding response OmpR family regulator
MLFNIFFLDDDPEIYEQMKTEWEKHGGQLTCIHSVQDAISKLQHKEYHLIEIVADHISESLLPAIKEIREASDLPIVIMTSHFSSVEKVASLRIGADEYLSIPETLEETVMTGYAHIRRYCGLVFAGNSKKTISYDGIIIEPDKRKVMIDGNEVRFTRGEFSCLTMLVSQPGRVFSYETLYYGSFGEDAPVELIHNSIHSFIYRIRKKIGSDYAKYIQQVYGIGYKLDRCG